MSLIEGIGDEVIHFFLLLAIAFIALVAWWSTNLSERPLVRTVFIVERRTIRRAPADIPTITSDVTDTSEILQEGSEILEENKTSQSNTDADSQIVVGHVDNCDIIQSSESNSDGDGNGDSGSSSAADSPEQADECIVRNRRLAFFESKQDRKPTEEEEEVPASDCVDEHASIADYQSENSNECNVRNRWSRRIGWNESGDDSEAAAEDTNSVPTVIDDNTPLADCETENSNDGNIRIRLKYLNEDQKLVEGKLQEQLGDFKRRHFSLELGGRKLVRLIFKGQVLQEDSKTLQNCGFFDNCVVHCLVQSRTPPPSPSTNRPRNDSQSNNDNSQHWDLGNILFASLSLLLGLAWYGRYHYAQLYTATTTVALVGLTGIFTVSLIGMYMPDTDGVRA